MQASKFDDLLNMKPSSHQLSLMEHKRANKLNEMDPEKGKATSFKVQIPRNLR